MIQQSGDEPPERAGAAIVRAWVEPGRSPGLRVRVTEIVDLNHGDGRVNPVVRSADEVCAILGRWLSELVEDADRRANNRETDAQPDHAPEDPTTTR